MLGKHLFSGDTLFPGGPGNDYITLYITTGFGRMRHLGVDIDVAVAHAWPVSDLQVAEAGGVVRMFFAEDFSIDL